VYIKNGLGLPAHNARRDAAGLLDVVRSALAHWVRSQESGVRADTDLPYHAPDFRLQTLDSK
jgi:hypothetical protein